MSTSTHNARLGPKLSTRAVDVAADDVVLVVFLEDGRSVSAPIAWFPRLANASDEQRANWRLIGRGVGIHWPDIDEDISVENLLGADGHLLAYRNSYESRAETTKANHLQSDGPADDQGAPRPTPGLGRSLEPGDI